MGLSSVHGRDTLTTSDVVKLLETVACLHCILGSDCFALLVMMKNKGSGLTTQRDSP